MSNTIVLKEGDIEEIRILVEIKGKNFLLVGKNGVKDEDGLRLRRCALQLLESTHQMIDIEEELNDSKQ